MSITTETYISVDVETAGPYPGSYSLLAIGACLVSDPKNNFYVEIQPVNAEATAEALEISQLNMVELKERGTTPQEAMSGFADWLRKVTGEGSQPIFVAFNAPFDWMFISDYFYRYLGHNPFGHKALDIKATYMGLMGVPWDETGWHTVSNRYLDNRPLKHHALQDAQDQAEVFRKMLEERGDRGLVISD
jgi:DNA polymerase III epsilon subunit-like protein